MHLRHFFRGLLKREEVASAFLATLLEDDPAFRLVFFQELFPDAAVALANARWTVQVEVDRVDVRLDSDAAVVLIENKVRVGAYESGQLLRYYESELARVPADKPIFVAFVAPEGVGAHETDDLAALAIDSQNPEVLYAGLGEGAGVFKSTDGGELWGAINTGLNIECPSYLLPIGRVKQGISVEQPPRRVVGADYYPVPWTSIWDIVIDPTDSQTLYAADHHSGVYLSTDGGATWVPINEGLSTRAVTAMAISSDGTVLYAATQGEGVFRLGAIEFDLIYLPLVLR